MACPKCGERATRTINYTYTLYRCGTKNVNGTLVLGHNCLVNQVNKLQEFKDYVHRRLDKFDVPSDPKPEETQLHGCRIEGRLDWLFRQHNELKMYIKDIQGMLKRGG